MVASLTISLLALAACTFHFHTAALKINNRNALLQDSRNNLKTLRAKRRAVDSCERFITGYRLKEYDVCIPLNGSDAFCSKTRCPNKPSPPKKIHYNFYLNKTAKSLVLNITWEEPRFGLDDLCGFQIQINSLSKVLRTDCIQLNSKDRFTFAYPGVGFGVRYEIKITSLPGYEKNDRSSNSITFTSPDKCTLFRQLNESLPWYCEIKTKFPVVCESGKINVTLQKLKSVDIDSYFSIITMKDSFGILIKSSLHAKNQSFAIYTGLKLDTPYVTLITFRKGKMRYTVSSQPFTCKSKVLEPTEKNHLLLILLVSLAVCVLLAFVILIKCFLVPKVRIFCHIRQRQTLSKNEEDIPLPDGRNSRVLLVYPSGCEQLNQLLLFLGQLLRNMDCECILDLVMEEAVLENGHRDIFIMENLDNITEDDGIILVNYKDTNDDSQNALKRHLELIFGRIYQQNLNTNNFIALHFNKKEETKFSSNIHFTGNIAKKLEKLVRIIWKIPPYRFGNRCPLKNTIQIGRDLEEKMILTTHELMASKHHSCSKDTCPKGQKPVNSKEDYFAVFNGNANPKNSFSSISLDDTTDDLHGETTFL